MIEADVLIAGGGLAGVACAVALARSGLLVMLVESDARLGGRAASWTHPATGDPIAIGPHIVLSEYLNFLSLLDILGTREHIRWEGRTFVTMAQGETYIDMRDSPFLPAPFQYIASLIADPLIDARDWLSNVPATLYALSLDERDILALDRRPALEVLRRLGVSRRYIDYFWEFTCRSIMNIPLEECSAGAILRFYRRLIGKSGYRTGYAAIGLGDLFAGPAGRYVEDRKGRVLLNCGVSGVIDEDGRAGGALLADGRCVRARHVVCALPPDGAYGLMPTGWREREPVLAALQDFRPVPYISIYLWFRRKLTGRRFWARVFRADDLNCDFYDLSNILEDPPPRSLIASNIIDSGRAGALSDSQIVDRTLAELAESVPAATADCLEHAVVHRIPLAIPRPRIGAESLRPDSRTRIPGLVLAGDWCRTGFPYSMESACASGWRAAEVVLEDRGTPARLVRKHRELGPVAALLGGAVRLARRGRP